jgi:hypothetical protein
MVAIKDDRVGAAGQNWRSILDQTFETPRPKIAEQLRGLDEPYRIEEAQDWRTFGHISAD